VSGATAATLAAAGRGGVLGATGSSLQAESAVSEANVTVSGRGQRPARVVNICMGVVPSIE